MTKDTVKEFVDKNKTSIIVVALLLLISFISIGVLMLTRTEGDTIVVSVGKDVIGEYDLATDGVYSLNGGTNVLTVKDGLAYVTYSNCPGHDCERQGKIKYVGQSISCLPNDLTVEIKAGDGPASEGGVDLVS